MTFIVEIKRGAATIYPVVAAFISRATPRYIIHTIDFHRAPLTAIVNKSTRLARDEIQWRAYPRVTSSPCDYAAFIGGRSFSPACTLIGPTPWDEEVKAPAAAAATVSPFLIFARSLLISVGGSWVTDNPSRHLAVVPRGIEARCVRHSGG